jgi:hypothetical protein
MTAWVAVLASLGLAACSSSAPDGKASGDAGSSGATSRAGSSSGAGGVATAPTAGSGADASGGLGGAVTDGGSNGSAGADDASAGAAPALALTFTARTSPVSGDLQDLATNGDVIVAVGSHQLIYSDDGVSWSTPDPAVPVNAIAFGGSTFVALGDQGVYTSNDGKSWTASATGTIDFRSVSYAFGQFYRVAFSVAGGAPAVSPDGVTWGAAGIKFSDASYVPDWSNTTLTGSAGSFVYVSTSWSTPGHNFGSTDGKIWYVLKDWTSLTYDVTYDGATYCSVGAYSGGASKDAKTWTTTGAGMRSVTSYNGVFYAVGGFGAVRASRDCLKWEAGAEPPLPDYLPNSTQAGLDRIRVHKDKLVIVGKGGHIFTSP